MRIEVRSPAEVAEVSLALQAANQQRLADRQADGWAERDASRLAERAQLLVDNPASRRAANDPWRGAVPEFEPVPEVRARLFGKRFEVAGAYFQFRGGNRLTISTADRQVQREILLPSAPQWHEIFPVGGDRVMIVFHGWTFNVTYGETQGSTVYSSCQASNCFEAREAFDNDLAWRLFWEETPGFSSFEVVFSTMRECNEQSTPGFETVTSYEITPWFCVATVSRTQIEIRQSWPEQFKTVIGQKYTVATGGGNIVNVGELKYSFNGTTQIIDIQINYTDKPPVVVPYTLRISGTFTPVGYDQDVEPTTTPNSYQQVTLEQFTTPGGPDIFAERVFYPLMRSYGYGHLVNRDQNGQTQAWGNTPAVFSFIKNYQGEFHKEDGDRMMLINGMSYQYARDNYFPIDAPQYFLTAGVVMPQAEQDTTGNYYWFAAPPIDGSVYFNDPMAFRNDGTTTPAVVLHLNRQPYSREVVQQTFAITQEEMEEDRFNYFATGLQIPVAAWDWDRPLACWIELSRLGFTPEDLMLSESEAQALAEANWEEAGFKF